MRCSQTPPASKSEKHVGFGESEDFLFGVKLWPKDDEEDSVEPEQDDKENLLVKFENAVAVDDIAEVLSTLDTSPHFARYCGPRNQQTLLHRSAHHGAHVVVKTCLYSLELTNSLKCIDANVECRDYERTRPLYWAVRGGHVDVVQTLLEAGAVETPLNVFGDSAAHVAVWHQQEPTVRLLMEEGCSVNLTNADGQTPLHLLMQHAAHMPGRHFQGLLDALLEKSDIDKSYADMTPLHQVIEQGGTSETLRRLLARGIDWSRPPYQVCPPLNHCVHYGRTDLLVVLLTHICDSASVTAALHAAVDSGMMADVRLLVAAGADVNDLSGAAIHIPSKGNKKKTKPFTMMHRALMHRDFQVARYLLDHRADPAIDCLPPYLLRMCYTFTLWHSYNPFSSYSSNLSGMSQYHLEVLYLLQRTLLRYPHTANLVCPESGTSVLWIASSNGTLCLAMLLIQRGADVHAKNRDGTSVLRRLIDCRTGHVIKPWKLPPLHRLVHTIIHCITDFRREPWLGNFLDVEGATSTWPRDILRLLKARMSAPASLKAQCRAAILSRLHGERVSSVNCLGLPRMLQDFLLYRDLHQLQYDLTGGQPDGCDHDNQHQQQCLCLFLHQLEHREPAISTKPISD